jgi:serine/threonine protein kinase
MSGNDECDVYEKHKIGSDHELFNPSNIFLLHLQMEFCSRTLRETIQLLNKELDQKMNQALTRIGYFISCELLIEILESVNILHKINIIHRDLKPTNILISEGTNGKFVKIADFGLATIHNKNESHTQGSGTFKYMAPEVLRKRNYDTKADIYSLGVIIPELFNFDMYE